MTRTQRKSLEAQFFLMHLEKDWRHVPNFDFYLSAFISAARSVLWVMRSEFLHIPGWTEWYNEKHPSSEMSEFLRKLNNVRVRSVKTIPIKTRTKAKVHIPPSKVTSELLEWLSQSHGKKVRLIPADSSNTNFAITDGSKVLAEAELQSAQHELPEFPGENCLLICLRYLSWLEGLVAECHDKFAI